MITQTENITNKTIDFFLLKKFFAENKIQLIFDYLFDFENKIHTENYNDILLLSSQYNLIENQNNKGVISLDEYILHQNRIKKGIISIFSKMELDNRTIEYNSTKKNTAIIELTLQKDFLSFEQDEQRELLLTIESLLKLNNSIKIQSVYSGSTNIVIEIPNDKIEQLIAMIDDKTLSKFNIKSYKILNSKSNEKIDVDIKNNLIEMYPNTNNTIKKENYEGFSLGTILPYLAVAAYIGNSYFWDEIKEFVNHIAKKFPKAKHEIFILKFQDDYFLKVYTKTQQNNWYTTKKNIEKDIIPTEILDRLMTNKELHLRDVDDYIF